MSSTTKKKHVTKEVLEEYPLPDETRQVVKVTAARGNNLHEVICATGDSFLVSMPPKFRKHVWIKRGDFILIDPIKEGDKVKGEITHILFKDQIKHIQENNLWPDAFKASTDPRKENTIPDDMLPPSDSDDSDREDLGDLVVNMNRVRVNVVESEDSSSEEDDEDEVVRPNQNTSNEQEDSVCDAVKDIASDCASKSLSAGSLIDQGTVGIVK